VNAPRSITESKTRCPICAQTVRVIVPMTAAAFIARHRKTGAGKRNCPGSLISVEPSAVVSAEEREALGVPPIANPGKER